MTQTSKSSAWLQRAERLRGHAKTYRDQGDEKRAAMFDEAALAAEEIYAEKRASSKTRIGKMHQTLASMGRRFQRDSRGWQIPREGTLARRVYDLAVLGKTAEEIRAALPDKNQNTKVDTMLRRIKNPVPI